MKLLRERRFAVGAEPGAGGTAFRVWAPDRRRIAVVSVADQAEFPLESEGNGYFSGVVSALGPGARYLFRVDDAERLYPDPATRFQPEGPHGPSQVVDASRFEWRDRGFREVSDARVIYELHVGTFTPEGTFRAAAAQFAELVELGVTIVELMPVNGFPGKFGWGYDGVNLWAPAQIYGSPDDLRFLIATAHELGLAVILDVVYNHFGPDGNYLHAFSAAYFSEAYANEWGQSLNFDGRNSAGVREFFRENARYWIEEFHFDGLRLDATHAIIDQSETHIVAEIVQAARLAGERLTKPVFVVAENEAQQSKLVRAPEAGGYGADAVWNDDFHHSALVALTGRHEYYYDDYRGTPQELLSAVKWGYLFQGQYSHVQQKRRGTPAFDLHGQQFVTYLQNHDQIANSATGARIDRLTSPAELRALTALLLLSPSTPLLFQGQEFGASAPFLFFIDHGEELASAINQGRHQFLAQFPAAASEEVQRQLAEATSVKSFERCKLDFSEREEHAPVYRLHRDLLRLRRSDPAVKQRRTDRVQGSVIGERALALRMFCDEGDRLLITNLGADLDSGPLADPLLAPPEGCSWRVLWSSEALIYGGQGYARAYVDGRVNVPARSSILFCPSQDVEHTDSTSDAR
jgi:maltooligosyltrehalose trehalohydrolase